MIDNFSKAINIVSWTSHAEHAHPILLYFYQYFYPHLACFERGEHTYTRVHFFSYLQSFNHSNLHDPTGVEQIKNINIIVH